MGMTVFSGMLVATLVGVIVVPAMYIAVERYLVGDKDKSSAVPDAGADTTATGKGEL